MDEIISEASKQKASIFIQFIQFSHSRGLLLVLYRNDDQEGVLHWMDVLKSLVIA